MLRPRQRLEPMFDSLVDGPRLRADVWQRLGASKRVVNWVRHGVTPKFASLPPRFNEGAYRTKNDLERKAWCETRNKVYLQQGAIEPAKCLHYVSASFMIPKKAPGKYRLIADERTINKYTPVPSLKYATLRHLSSIVKPGDFTLSMDLEGGYYQFSIHPDYRKYFTFGVDGEYFQYIGLPMGWNCSPYVFTTIMAEFVKMLRSPKPLREEVNGRWITRKSKPIRVLPYLDDFLFVFSSYQQAKKGAKYIKLLMRMLGLRWAADKTDWTPRTRREHLGLTFDTVLGTFEVPAPKAKEVKLLAKELLSSVSRNARLVPVKTLAKFAGKCVSMSLAIAPSRFFLRSIYDAITTKDSWQGYAKLSNQAVRDLRWWAKLPVKWHSAPLWVPTSTRSITVDASELGWGAVLDDGSVAHAFWSEEELALHITSKEMLAVLYGVQSFKHNLRGSVVRLLSDNTATVGVSKLFTSKSPDMMAVARRLFWLLDVHRIKLQPQYQPGVDNIADGPSRFVDYSDWSVTHSYFAQMMSQFGPCTIDRFASYTSAKCKVYNSKFADPETSGIDAFAQVDWPMHVNYCNPPWELLPRLVDFVEQFSSMHAVVVAPLWPKAMWFAKLMSLSNDYYVIPRGRKVFTATMHRGNTKPFVTQWPVVVVLLKW